MARTTTNKSLRSGRREKSARLADLAVSDANEGSRVAGASGQKSKAPRRPGRAASLLSSSNRTRSQLWRSTPKTKAKTGSPTPRRGVLGKGTRGGRRTG